MEHISILPMLFWTCAENPSWSHNPRFDYELAPLLWALFRTWEQRAVVIDRWSSLQAAHSSSKSHQHFVGTITTTLCQCWWQCPMTKMLCQASQPRSLAALQWGRAWFGRKQLLLLTHQKRKEKEGKRGGTLKIFVSSVAGSLSTAQALRGYHSKAAEAAVCAELRIGGHKLVSDNLNWLVWLVLKKILIATSQ
jgi:hypothetical protein